MRSRAPQEQRVYERKVGAIADLWHRRSCLRLRCRHNNSHPRPPPPRWNHRTSRHGETRTWKVPRWRRSQRSWFQARQTSALRQRSGQQQRHVIAAARHHHRLVTGSARPDAPTRSVLQACSADTQCATGVFCLKPSTESGKAQRLEQKRRETPAARIAIKTGSCNMWHARFVKSKLIVKTNHDAVFFRW